MASAPIAKLDRPVDIATDHILGREGADITLVEYGSYDCPHCRSANEPVAEARDTYGERLRYVFRHRPVTDSDLARRAAELVEHARDEQQFWNAHIKLMTRSESLTEDDLRAVAVDLGVPGTASPASADASRRASERVEADIASARASGVTFTPTFFINERRYDGPWDAASIIEALMRPLGHRLRAAALDFASWAPAAGLSLLAMTFAAVALTNTAPAASFTAFWERALGVSIGNATFAMPLIDWINHGLLSVFFLVVGLEIKRELTVGHLAGRRAAALPVAAAIGGMVIPATLYALLIPAGGWAHGWGVPMATDTAFAVALIALMGRRVPIELRIFLTAATIIDDIGAIAVVALFYSSKVDIASLAAAAGCVAVLAFLNYARVYRVAPYLLTGVALWAFIHAGGVHATLAGVLLALFIPTRPPPNLNALMAQANATIAVEARHGDEVLRHGPSLPALRTLDTIHDRLESPAARTLRHLAPRSSFLVLPVFALANAGVVLSPDILVGHGPLVVAIICGLVIGKPLGILAFAALAVRLGIATKPQEYSWGQVAGAGALSGIGFTMSLFIAHQAFPLATDFAAAKIAVFAASAIATVIGVGVLWASSRHGVET